MGFPGAWLQWNPAYLVFFVYSLRFQQEVWVADHDHHVLELQMRDRARDLRLRKRPLTGNKQNNRAWD